MMQPWSSRCPAMSCMRSATSPRTKHDQHAPTDQASIVMPRMRALVAMQEGKFAQALADLEPSRPYEMAGFVTRTVRATIYMKMGQPGKAAADYQASWPTRVTDSVCCIPQRDLDWHGLRRQPGMLRPAARPTRASSTIERRRSGCSGAQGRQGRTRPAPLTGKPRRHVRDLRRHCAHHHKNSSR